MCVFQPSKQSLSIWFCVFACACFVLGTKLWLIHENATVAPLGDQWDGEALWLYEPYLNGHLDWLSELFSAHNEHRILFTRVLDLLLLELAGQWDPVLQMMVNAALHTTFVVLLLFSVLRWLPGIVFFGLCLFASMLFAIPFAIENILGAFQSPFYLLLLFSIAAISLVVPSRTFSSRWWIGTVLGLSSVFCLASGALTLVPLIAVRGGQLLLGVRRGLTETIGIGVHLGITIALVLTIPTVVDHARFKAHTLNEFLDALWIIAGWPISFHWWSPILMLLPYLALCGLAWQWRPIPDHPIWLGLALVLWVLIQVASIAYGRSAIIAGSRYLDIAILSVFANFAIACWLASNQMCPKLLGIICGSAIALWVVVLAYCLLSAAATVPSGIAVRRDEGQVQAANIRSFLQDSSASPLIDKSFPQIPYPNSERLEMILRNDTIRSVLPSDLTNGLPGASNVHGKLLLKGYFAPYVAKAKMALLSSAPLLVAISIMLFAFAIPWMSSRDLGWRTLE